jgi:hypothetical protein
LPLKFEQKESLILGRYALTGPIISETNVSVENSYEDILDINRKPRIIASILSNLVPNCIDSKIFYIGQQRKDYSGKLLEEYLIENGLIDVYK